ncbi:cupredoxin domain-containing protein [Cohnella nanjingensis]|uniref:Cupredoxin domain-containing protein n=1 Tax=Cohnella nanjingensis TaxID=1387779 RepID=A0A7X0RS73_9BACL|nr:cupredoxin domain-containing protein [Cohnella nanjingensis]MBB6672575.1 cupredoxin domain-containing protein [Cohnella nanjingensis]
MSKVMFISKRRIQWYIVAAALVVLGGAYIGWQRTQAATAPISAETQVYQLVTGEFTSTTENGKQLEAYVFAPDTLVVKKGQPVELRITGVSGQSHPFSIEGLGVQGTVNKGKTTVVRFTAEQAGTYPIICETHNDPKTGIPMVGYIVVQ